MKIKKNDNILVISGKSKGKSGIVSKVLVKENKLIVIGINVSKKNIKPSKKNPHGGIIDIHLPIAVSNVAIVCPSCNKPTKIAYKISGKTKERVCRKCKSAVTFGVKNDKIQ